MTEIADVQPIRPDFPALLEIINEWMTANRHHLVGARFAVRPEMVTFVGIIPEEAELHVDIGMSKVMITLERIVEKDGRFQNLIFHSTAFKESHLENSSIRPTIELDDPDVLPKLVDGIRTREDIIAERDAIRFALARLVAAKDEKDAHGETDRYRELKAGAWERARAVLGHAAEPDVSSAISAESTPALPSTPETIPAELAGKWIAWSPDGLRIVGHGDTMEEAELMGGGGDDLIVELVAQKGEFRMAGGNPLDGLHEESELSAAQTELAEARRLLSLNPFFRCGSLLPDSPAGWRCGFLDSHDALKAVTIDSYSHSSKADWVVEVIGLGCVLGVDGEWIEDESGVDGSRYFFETPGAALDALEAWRNARRAEIAAELTSGRDGKNVAQEEDAK